MPARNRHRSIHTELLFNLAFLASAGMLVVGLTALTLSRFDPDRALPALLVLWGAATAVFLGFGAYLVRHTVLEPLGRLQAVADSAANGEATRHAEAFGTREFDDLGQRMQHLAEQLLEGPPREGWETENEGSWAAQAGRGA